MTLYLCPFDAMSFCVRFRLVSTDPYFYKDSVHKDKASMSDMRFYSVFTFLCLKYVVMHFTHLRKKLYFFTQKNVDGNMRMEDMERRQFIKDT